MSSGGATPGPRPAGFAPGPPRCGDCPCPGCALRCVARSMCTLASIDGGRQHHVNQVADVGV